MSGTCDERQSGTACSNCTSQEGCCSIRTVQSEGSTSLRQGEGVDFPGTSNGVRSPKDTYRIDSHKLMYHPERVTRWLHGEKIYPIYVEISPTSACNHRCVFCGLDFVGYKPRYLDWRRLKEIFYEFERLGIKSVMFGGEGEPFLNDDLSKMVVTAFYHNLDVALTTNGTLFNNPYHYLGVVKWIKTSINAGTPQSYSQIHRTSQNDFHTVIRNMERAAEVRARERCRCTLGMQAILLDKNKDTIHLLAEIARDIGMDYLVIKPYSHHPSSKHKDFSVDISHIKDISERLMSYNTDSFEVIFRLHAFKQSETIRNYEECLALPFWAYISTEGDVWNCSAKMGNDDTFFLGNIYKTPFENIWKNHFDSSDLYGCRVNCRMNSCNEYLWKLKYPDDHVNFI